MNGGEKAVGSITSWTCTRAHGAVLERSLCAPHGRGVKVKADNPDDAAYDAAARELAFEAKVGVAGLAGVYGTCWPEGWKRAGRRPKGATVLPLVSPFVACRRCTLVPQGYRWHHPGAHCNTTCTAQA